MKILLCRACFARIGKTFFKVLTGGFDDRFGRSFRLAFMTRGFYWWMFKSEKLCVPGWSEMFYSYSWPGTGFELIRKSFGAGSELFPVWLGADPDYHG